MTFVACLSDSFVCVCVRLRLQACVCVCSAAPVQAHRGDGGPRRVCNRHPASDRQRLGAGHPQRRR